MPRKRINFFFYQPPIVRKKKNRRSKPKWTIMFITFCVAVFFFDVLAYSLFKVDISDTLAFTPSKIFIQPWTFVTSIFLHGGLEHLFFNMFALFMFGIYLESRVTEKQFLFIFFLAGLLGNTAYYLLDPSSPIPAVGASGAIYGVMGALAILYPGLVVYFFGIAPMPMIFAAAMWLILEFSGLFIPSNISNEAHLAGLIIGMMYGGYLRKDKDKIRFFWEK